MRKKILREILKKTEKNMKTHSWKIVVDGCCGSSLLIRRWKVVVEGCGSGRWKRKLESGIIPEMRLKVRLEIRIFTFHDNSAFDF